MTYAWVAIYFWIVGTPMGFKPEVRLANPDYYLTEMDCMENAPRLQQTSPFAFVQCIRIPVPR